MSDSLADKLIKQALIIETAQRTAFIDQIEDEEIKAKIKFLLEDDTELTDFLINTSGGADSFTKQSVKDFKAGDKIKQFIIKQLIAKGGMGAVYLAYDTKLKRNVAIKTIRAELLRNETSLKRFEQEALILSRINHPSICQIYDYIDYEDGDLLVLEYVIGHTLNKVSLTYEQKIDAFIEIISALEAAHEKGVIHRDLKPDNIMITDDGSIKILDFGIAKSQIKNFTSVSKSYIVDTQRLLNPNLTKVGSMMGTLVYMSPEQASFQDITPASDIYSMGIIMHQILTGKAPYNLEKTDDLKKQVVNAKLTLERNIPNGFVSLIKSMTSIKSAERPSASQLKITLQEIKDKPKKQKRAIKTGVFIITAVLLLVILIWQLQKNSSQKEINVFKLAKIEEINNAKALLKKAYMLPLHDIREEQNRAQKIVKELAINENKNLPENDKNKLLGEANFAIEHYDKALTQLEKVWQENPSNPKLALTIAQSYIEKYWHEIFSANDIQEEKDSYVQQVIKNNQKLLDKANEYFSAYEAGKKDSSKTLNNTLAYEYFAKKHYKKALAAFDQTHARKQGDFKAFNFLGNIYSELYKEKLRNNEQNKGHDYLNKSIQAHIQAISFGRSYAQSYLNLCLKKVELMRLKLYNESSDAQDIFKQTYTSCKQAISINPDNSYSLNLTTNVILLYAQWLYERGQEVDDYIEEAISWNEQAIERDPTAYSYKMKAYINEAIATVSMEQGIDPREELDAAIDAYHKAIALQPRFFVAHTANIFYTLEYKFTYLIEHGISVIPEMNKAHAQYVKALSDKYFVENENVDLFESYAYLLHLTALSEHSFNRNPRAWIKKSLDTYKRASKIPRNDKVAEVGIVGIKLFLAEVAFEEGKWDKAFIDEIALEFQQLKSVETICNWFIFLESDFEKLQLRHLLASGKDITSPLNNMHDYLNKAIKLKPDDPEAYLKIAEYYAIKTAYSTLQNSHENIKAALDYIEQAHELNPNIAQTYLLKAWFLQYINDHEIVEFNMDSSPLKLKKKAISINPQETLLDILTK